MKIIFAGIILFSIVSPALCSPFGVFPPDVQCIKHDRVHVFNVTTYSGSNFTAVYSASISRGENISNDPFNTEGFIAINPRDYANVTIFLNSSLLKEGTNNFLFLFCREGSDVNVSVGSLDVRYCIQAPISVNVSDNCPEEQYVINQKQQKSNLFIYNISISFVIGLLILMLIFKRIFRK